jgi:hypothetical protein
MQLKGSCHCRAVRFTLGWPGESLREWHQRHGLHGRRDGR